RTVWSLLTQPVLPLDYREQAGEVRKVLRERNRQAGGHLDLGRLEHLAAQLEERLVGIYSDPDADPRAFNALLRRLSRALVPLDYTSGDRFGHDPALAQPALPALADCSLLSELQPGSQEAHFPRARLRRSANRVEAGLRAALAACEEYGSPRREGPKGG